MLAHSIDDVLDRTVDVGVIGAGRISSAHHLPVLSYIPQTNVKYVYDVDGQRTQRLSKHYDFERVPPETDQSGLPDCDVALLAIPVGVREPYITEYADRDTPIFSEKPYAPDLETHQRCIDHAIPQLCNYIRLTWSGVQQLNRLLRSNAFGALQEVEIDVSLSGSTNLSKGTYQTEEDVAGGGILIERGCHDLSQLVYLFSDLALEAAAIRWQDGLDVAVDADLRGTLGDTTVPIDYHISYIEPTVSTGARFHFEAGTVSLGWNNPNTTLTIETEDGQHPLQIARHEHYATDYLPSHYLRWQQFFAQVYDDVQPRVQTGVDVTRLVTEIYERGRQQPEVVDA